MIFDGFATANSLDSGVAEVKEMNAGTHSSYINRRGLFLAYLNYNKIRLKANGKFIFSSL
jgi:hypothetical protein